MFIFICMCVCVCMCMCMCMCMCIISLIYEIVDVRMHLVRERFSGQMQIDIIGYVYGMLDTNNNKPNK